MAVRLGSMPDPEMLFVYQFKVVLRGSPISRKAQGLFKAGVAPAMEPLRT